MTLKSYQDQKAFEALKLAQLIAVGPFIFKAVASMFELGIMDILKEMEPTEFISKKEITKKVNASYYAVSILIDLAVAADIVVKNEKGEISPSKICYYLCNDKMTRVNFDFTNYVCYEGLNSLTESLKNSKAEGLKVFTQEYDTIYPFLSSLPPKAKEAWFGFDHYYSDHVFFDVLKVLFSIKKFKNIFDIGGNTGKFSLEATDFDEEVNVKIIDLPQQCATAQENIKKANKQDRISTFGVNILDKDTVLPKGADLIWMSQFLDCFSVEQIKHILTLAYDAMDENCTLVINEIFGDSQKNDIASLVIEATSLYFTALANGKSRFYHAEELISILEEVGFKLQKRIDGFGLGHTLLFVTK
jgi:hypothetical protein